MEISFNEMANGDLNQNRQRGTNELQYGATSTADDRIMEEYPGQIIF